MSLPAFLQGFEGYGTYSIVNLIYHDDGYGGQNYEWAATYQFDAVMSLDESIATQLAEKQGVKGVYTLTFAKPTRLPWHTVICRSNDLTKCYRVTSKDEKSTPSSSALNMRLVRCEEYELPLPGAVESEGDNG